MSITRACSRSRRGGRLSRSLRLRSSLGVERGSISGSSTGLLAVLLAVGGRVVLCRSSSGAALSSGGGGCCYGGGSRGAGCAGGGVDVGRAAGSVLDDGPPFLSVGGGVGFELEFGGGVEGVSDLAAGDVFALDAELAAVDGADDAVGKVEGEFGGGVAAEVVVVFKFVQVACWRHDIVA